MRMKIKDIDKFKELILAGKTIKELQEYFNCSRTEVTDTKRIHGLVGLSPNSKKLNRESGDKQCSDCGAIKPFTEFYSNGKTSTGLIKYKPNCINCENSSRKDTFFSFILEYLSLQGKQYICENCKDTDKPGFLDWHHKDSKDKLFTIGSLSKSMSIEYFMETVVPELNKCKLLCPNCHRREHLVLGWK